MELIIVNNKELLQKSWMWRPKYDELIMLKIYFLQQWFNLSDPAMEEAIYDRISFQRFLDIDIVSDNIPDETTILNFRHFLEEYKIQEKLFKRINRILKENGLIMREWTIVDATIIQSSSSTKNKKWERDPEMKSTKKWNQYYFWMKTHIWVDKENGLVHTIECTSANVHDSKLLEQLLHWEEKEIYWDSAYYSEQKLNEKIFSWTLFNVCMKWYRNKPLTQLQK